MSKKRALKNFSVSGSRDQSLVPKYFNTKHVGINQAISGMGSHTDINQSSVQPATTISGGRTGTTDGSTQPQAPDQASVTRSVIAARVGKPPQQHQPGMTGNYEPPRDAATPQQTVRKLIKQRRGFK